MCLAIPLRIKSIEGMDALCEANGITQKVRVDFTPGAGVGDYVMVHAGFAIQTMSEEEAGENLKLLEEVRDAL